MSSVVEEKKNLRSRMKLLRGGISEEALKRHRLWVTDWFCKVCVSAKPSALFSYIDVANETPTRGAIEIALLKGVPVFLPKTYPNGLMVFVNVQDLNELEESRYHIPEPNISGETMVLGRPEFEKIVAGYVNGPLNYRDIYSEEYRDALMLVPGLAFSEEGYRLGYGGGYYDRYVKDATFTTMAMAYDFQILPEIPREEHDAKCDQMFILKTL